MAEEKAYVPFVQLTDGSGASHRVRKLSVVHTCRYEQGGNSLVQVDMKGGHSCVFGFQGEAAALKFLNDLWS